MPAKEKDIGPNDADTFKTEKEKGKADPAGKPQEPEKVKPVDIPANEPYPSKGD